MNAQPLGRFEWERIIRRLDLPPMTKLVALMLATYSNRDGSNAHPGARRLGEDCSVSERTAFRHLADLERHGLISNTTPEHIGRYRRLGMANVYRLTTPDDFGDLVPKPDHMSGVTGDRGEDGTKDHLSGVTEHMSPVTDHMSGLTDHLTPEAGSPVTGDIPPSSTTPSYQSFGANKLSDHPPALPSAAHAAATMTTGEEKTTREDEQILAALGRLADEDPQRHAELQAKAEELIGWVFITEPAPYHLRARASTMHQLLTEGATP